MPIVSPKLDDLRHAQVVDLLRRRIPVHAPEWTDHNDSDPGVALIQLFGYLAEQIGYRLDRVPDKNYVEFLRLIGIQLHPAAAARTTMAFVLAKPETTQAFAVPAGARVKASAGEPPPVFEIDAQADCVPAQLAALCTTRSDDLRDITRADTGPIPDGEDADDYVPARFSLTWDGSKPKLADMPTQPVGAFQLASEASHRHLWIGLAFNPSRSAGFLGQRVTFSVQLDDDEQPDARAQVNCGTPPVLGLLGHADDEVTLESGLAAPVSYAYYRPPQPGEVEGAWRQLVPISDTTDAWTRSGRIRFDVPVTLGAVPDGEWRAPRAPAPKTIAELCDEASGGGGGSPPVEPIEHPLPGALKQPVQGTPDLVPVSGWLRVSFSGLVPAFSVRALSFNTASATNAQTVRGEVLGLGDGRPGQRFQLAFGDVLANTLDLAVVDPDDGLLHGWREVEDLDAVGPDERVYALDREAGVVVFGDGLRGRPPAQGMRVVARSYRHGGGASGERDVGLVDQLESLPAPISAAVNITAARGGRDAETLAAAKRRAPRELAVRGRAVTAADFEFLALQTEGVRVARAIVVPLRRPYPPGAPQGPGLDLATRAAGAVSVVVVPDAPGLYPTPTGGMLRAVCRHLDLYRLITTELHTVAPQYVRLFDVSVTVRPAPGYGRTQLREAIAEHLETYFHALRGGPDGTGFGFGTTVHHADLVAQIFRVDGVARVEDVVAFYDGVAPSPPGEPPPMQWRAERQAARRLTACPETDADDEEITLAPDETVFVDSTTLNVIVRAE